MTGSPRNSETWAVISSTTSWIDSGIGEGMGSGVGVREGRGVGVSVGLGLDVCVGTGSGLGLAGVCPMQAAASESIATNKSRKTLARE